MLFEYFKLKTKNTAALICIFSDVAKLVSALLSTNNRAINLKLMELGTINILLVSLFLNNDYILNLASLCNSVYFMIHFRMFNIKRVS